MAFKRILFFSISCLLVAECMSGDIAASTQTNLTAFYKVVVPKSGFIGAPASAAAWEPVHKPEKSEDFDEYLLKVIVIDDRICSETKRKVIRVDQVSTDYEMLREGLYYAYVDKNSSGSRIVCRYRDDNKNVMETGVAYGIPFPFTCATPLISGNHHGPRGYLDNRIGFGVKFESGNSSSNDYLNVNVTCFKSTSQVKHADRKMKWYQSEIDTVLKSQQTKIRFTEKQKWAKSEDILWDEMERFDKDGNILIRCKQVKPEDKK